MNQKRGVMKNKETQKDFDLGHSTDEYTKMSVELLKERFSGWLDWNMSLLEEKPEFHIKEEDKGLIIKITEEGSRDFMNDGTEYYMVLQSLKDENEVKEEIEKEKQYNKEHGVLVRETFPFPIGEDE
jgi:hypothetical protein